MLGLTEEDGSGPVTASTFLENSVEEGYTVTVAGHSLGGALSPCYALYLLNTWAEKKEVPVYARPVAGPTPGDAAFAAYYNRQLGNNTVRLWNLYDVIPHAWTPDLLRLVPNFYPTSPFCPAMLQLAIDGVIKATAHLGYTHIDGEGSTLPIRFYILADDKDFLAEVGLQHVDYYPTELQVSEFQFVVQDILGLPAPYFTTPGSPLQA